MQSINEKYAVLYLVRAFSFTSDLALLEKSPSHLHLIAYFNTVESQSFCPILIAF
jgi:hypothetical protein